MVVNRPGGWFHEVLTGLAAQDYPNLRTLVLVAGDPEEQAAVATMVAERLPRAFVRAVADNPGFGPVANEVLRLVEGDNGFFCFLHDDVALDPDAIRLLVEELYRSNAGVVGPKLVAWDDPAVLLQVGLAADRFGEIDPLVEPGETDQQQHDAVRDVFAVPSACLLVRADLFRTLGGFDPSLDLHGEDLELCWRVHLSGARVVVVPAARARHRAALGARRPDMAHVAVRARHRMRTVATLTGARRLPLVLVQALLVSFVEFLTGLVTLRPARGWASLRAVLGLVGAVPAIAARRRQIAAQRLVPDGEVADLQLGGSARLRVHLRSRSDDQDVQHHRDQHRPWRERAATAGVIALLTAVVLVALGSRNLITGGVPAVGQFLDFGESPRRLWSEYWSGWDASGLGATGPVPTAFALVSVASVLTGFRLGLLHTLAVIAPVIVGAVGMWRLSRALATVRARLVSAAVYAAAALPVQLLSVGRWGALAVFAGLPFVIDAARRAVGLEPSLADARGEQRFVPTPARRRQLLAGGVLAVAVIGAFEPSAVVLVAAIGVVLAAATAVTGAWSTALRLAAAVTGLAIGGWVLGLPWSLEIFRAGGWDAATGPRPVGDRPFGVLELLSFEIGAARATGLGLALYLPVLGAVLLGRGSRFAWAVRAAGLVLAFGWLTVLDARGSLPIPLVEPGILLVPVLVGVALAAGVSVAAFERDVRGQMFGWRQPLALLCLGASVVGVVPGALALQTGRWDMPTTSVEQLLGRLPQRPAEGDYRVLWLGDAEVLPAGAVPVRSGAGYAITNDRTLGLADVWAPRVADPADDPITAAIEAIATGTTARGGRLLAPFAVRYIIVPLVDGAESQLAQQRPLPAGLLDALGDQLDLAQLYSPPTLVIYENRSWLPVRSILTADGAAASRTAGAASLARAVLTGATPVMVGADHRAAASVGVPVGTVHLGVPFDEHWRLTVDGADIAPRPAFGATMAFDVEVAGTATLSYDSPTERRFIVFAQVLVWAIAVAMAAGAHLGRRTARVRLTGADDGAIIDLGESGR